MSEALNDACRLGYLNVVDRLLREGDDVHYENDYALRCACLYSHLDIVKLLVSYGAEIHSNTNILGNQEIVNYLKKQLLLEKINELS
jgi:ankyrin repeat protein